MPKDLTPYERSKVMVELVETAAEVDRQQFRPNVGQNPRGKARKPMDADGSILHQQCRPPSGLPRFLLGLNPTTMAPAAK